VRTADLIPAAELPSRWCHESARSWDAICCRQPLVYTVLRKSSTSARLQREDVGAEVRSCCNVALHPAGSCAFSALELMYQHSLADQQGLPPTPLPCMFMSCQLVQAQRACSCEGCTWVQYLQTKMVASRLGYPASLQFAAPHPKSVVAFHTTCRVQSTSSHSEAVCRCSASSLCSGSAPIMLPVDTVPSVHVLVIACTIGSHRVSGVRSHRSEVARAGGEPRLGVVVGGDLLVPGVHRRQPAVDQRVRGVGVVERLVQVLPLAGGARVLEHAPAYSSRMHDVTALVVSLSVRRCSASQSWARQYEMSLFHLCCPRRTSRHKPAPRPPLLHST
jgi:hypothetical protein